MAIVLTRESTLQGVLGHLKTESGMLDRIWKLELGAGAFILLSGIGVGLALGSWGLASVGGVLALLGAGHALKIRDNLKDVGRFQGGAEGEAVVSRALEKGLPDTYWVLNDVSVRSGSRSAQNDHIVLGPNGVFILETKAYSGTLSGNAEDDHLKQEKTWNGKTTTTSIKNPIPQNEYHREVVCEQMRDAGLATDDVHSIIIFTNKWVRLKIAGSSSGACSAPVVKPDFLCQTILAQPSRYGYDAAWLSGWVRAMAPGVAVPAVRSETSPAPSSDSERGSPGLR